MSRTILRATLGAAVVIGGWWLIAVAFFADSGAVPTPWAVLTQYAEDGWHFYAPNLSATLGEAAWGFLWGNVIAIALALVVLLIPRMESLVVQGALFTHCLPVIAIGPVLVTVFSGRVPMMTLSGLAVVFTTLIGTLAGLRSADSAALDVVRASGGGRWHQVTKVRIVAALPHILNATMISVPAAILGAVLAEYLGTVDNGLGIALVVAQKDYVVPRAWGITIVIGAVAVVGFLIVNAVTRVAVPWAAKTDSTLEVVQVPIWRRILQLIATGIVVAGVWWLLLKILDINPMVGRNPWEVFNYLFLENDAAQNRSLIFAPFATTLSDAALGFVAGLVSAFGMAVIVSLSSVVRGIVVPAAVVVRSMPLVAAAPLIFLAFGRGLPSVAILGGIIVFFPAFATILLGIASASESAKDIIVVNGGSRLSVLRYAEIPAAIPSIFTAARIGAPMAMTGALVAEWLATGKGSGSQMIQSVSAFDYSGLWAAVALVTISSVVIYAVIEVLEALVLARRGPSR